MRPDAEDPQKPEDEDSLPDDPLFEEITEDDWPEGVTQVTIGRWIPGSKGKKKAEGDGKE